MSIAWNGTLYGCIRQGVSRDIDIYLQWKKPVVTEFDDSAGSTSGAITKTISNSYHVFIVAENPAIPTSFHAQTRMRFADLV